MILLDSTSVSAVELESFTFSLPEVHRNTYQIKSITKNIHRNYIHNLSTFLVFKSKTLSDKQKFYLDFHELVCLLSAFSANKKYLTLTKEFSQSLHLLSILNYPIKLLVIKVKFSTKNGHTNDSENLNVVKIDK